MNEKSRILIAFKAIKEDSSQYTYWATTVNEYVQSLEKGHRIYNRYLGKDILFKNKNLEIVYSLQETEANTIN